MADRYALILNDEVQNVIMADQEFVDLISSNWSFIVQSDTAQIGDAYDPVTKEFTTPDVVVDEWPIIRTITVEKWYNRWTDEELGLFHALAATNDAIAGWEIWLGRQSAISLDDPRIVDRLQQGVTSGKITQARMDALLADVAEGEL